MPRTPRPSSRPYCVTLTDGYCEHFRVRVVATNPEKAAIKAMNRELAKFGWACRSVEFALRTHLEVKPPNVNLAYLARQDPEGSFARRAHRRRLTAKPTPAIPGPSWRAKEESGAWQLWDGVFEGGHSPAPRLPTVHPKRRPEPKPRRRPGRPRKPDTKARGLCPLDTEPQP